MYTQVRKNSLHIIINFISYLEQPKPVLKCEISHVCLSQIRKSKNYPFFLELVLPLVGMVWGSWPAWPIPCHCWALSLSTVDGFWLGCRTEKDSPSLGELAIRSLTMPQKVYEQFKMDFFVCEGWWRSLGIRTDMGRLGGEHNQDALYEILI